VGLCAKVGAQPTRYAWYLEITKAQACPRCRVFVSDAMTKRAFDKIKQGLDEARAYLDGTADKSRYRIHYAPRRTKTKRLVPIPPGEILVEEFLKPNGITQSRLSREIGVSRGRINDIVHGRSAITAAIALQLAKYFGTTPKLWMNLQLSYELHRTRAKD
jgi:addiction module HigA family antidote